MRQDVAGDTRDPPNPETAQLPTYLHDKTPCGAANKSLSHFRLKLLRLVSSK